MRTATRKVTHLVHVIPRTKRASQVALVKAKKISAKSLRYMKRKPLVTLSAALAVSAASGLLLWLGMRK